MDYAKILDELQNASLFELYRLNQAISNSLEDPIRINKIKHSLKVGQEIEYFDAEQNRLIEANILELKRTRLLVRNQHDGKVWDIPFYHVNVDFSNADINGSARKLDRNSLRVGDKVAFKDRKGSDLHGEVIKLNQKTAGVLVGTTRWKVSYDLLSTVIEGELGGEIDLIEGQVLGR